MNKKPTITLSDGTPMDLSRNQLNPLIGYQMHHRVTGRILPSCSRDEYYTLGAMSLKFKELYLRGCLGPSSAQEWNFVPFYQSELIDTKYRVIKTTDLIP